MSKSIDTQAKGLNEIQEMDSESHAPQEPSGGAEELAALSPFFNGRIQKASLTHDGRLVLELFGQRKAWLVIAPTHPTHPLALVFEKPPRDETPPGAQRIVRDALAGERLLDVRFERADVIRIAAQTRDERPRKIFLERGNDPRLILIASKSKDAEERVILVVGGDVKTKDGRDLRRGRPYVLPKGMPPHLSPLSLSGAVTAPQKVKKRDHGLATLRAQFKARHRRFSRLVKALEGDLRRHGDPQNLRLDGEALKSLLSQQGQRDLPRRGSEDVVIEDGTGFSRTITLDPTLDVVGNVDAIFRRARRAQAGQERIAPRLEEAQRQLAEVESVREELTKEAPNEETRLLAQDVAMRLSDKGARRKAAASGKRRAYRAFIGHGDVVIRVGRSAKDNDELTFHVAAGNDVWMHAREVPGSHVVFPAGPEVPTELLLDAAHLAAWFSPLAKDERMDVQWTRRKYIRKPGKGSAAGRVHITREKVLHLVVDNERTKRLLAREVEGELRSRKKNARDKARRR